MKSIYIDTFDLKKTHVCVWDNVQAPVGCVVISHGMAEHAERYDAFALELNGQGYVVLADDHRGHKYNAAGAKGMVEGDSFFQTIRDMKDVIDLAKNKYSQKVVLLGHSYGSFLAQRFIEIYSNDIEGCILSGTAYMISPLIKLAKKIATVQTLLFGPDKTGNLINQLSFGSYNKKFKDSGQKFAWLSKDRDNVDRYEADEYCGYAMSLGFYKSFFNGLLATHGRDKFNVRKDLPIFIAVGKDDPVSNYSALATSLYNVYKQYKLKDIEMQIYDGLRHEILNESSAPYVHDDCINFINRCLKKVESKNLNMAGNQESIQNSTTPKEESQEANA
ncbi:MAG: alpha/beta hydrolase [Christensenellaceae bacterium]|nr:alpha/beta hydrolase [Christensenellaceae bacterium]